jgi:DNA-binding LacI/PurR family transcriptional regulator
MDNRRGMYAAVNHLIEVHGRRRIAFVRGPATHDGAHERYQGYLDAMVHHGLASSPDLVSACPESWNPELAVAAVTRMLAGAAAAGRHCGHQRRACRGRPVGPGCGGSADA